jgi:hypothetical protein
MHRYCAIPAPWENSYLLLWGFEPLDSPYPLRAAVNAFACIIRALYRTRTCTSSPIGWLYVTLLVAVNEPGIVAGIVSFLFYGLLPCSLLLWLGGSKARRQRRAHQRITRQPAPGRWRSRRCRAQINSTCWIGRLQLRALVQVRESGRQRRHRSCLRQPGRAAMGIHPVMF